MQPIPASLIASVITSVLMTGAHAQDNTSLQFLAFPKKIPPVPVELIIGDNKTIEVQIPGNELSPEYKVPPLESIVVGKTTVNGEGKAVFEVYGKAKSIGTSKQIILLIRKGKDNSDGFVVLPINGELANFKGGSYFFINASGLNVAGVIGDSKFALKPGQQRMLKPAPDYEGDICQVTLAYQRDDKWKTFKDTRWPTNKRYRSLVFFHQDPESGRLGVSPVIDMLPFEESATN
jgi:hypothetical protein